MIIKKVRCLVPFTIAQFGNFGMVRTCCNKWNDHGPIGNLYRSTDFRSIWNSSKIQYLRSAVITDTVEKVCNPDICPYLLKNEYINLDKIKTENVTYLQIIEQVIEGKTELSTLPLTLNLANEGTCNLRCRMCLTSGVSNKPDATLQKNVYDKILPLLLPHLSTMIIAGNGEPLVREDTRKILIDKTIHKLNPNLKIEMITNGILFDCCNWEKISHNRFKSVSVSVDAATKETYETIRKGGKWEILIKNLSFISELRKQKTIPFFRISFLVIKSNYKEMVNFVNMGLELSCDEIIFQRPLGMNNINENYLLSGDVSTMAKIGKILNNPIFLNPKVNIDRVAFLKNLAEKKIRLLDIYVYKVKRCVFFIPIRCVPLIRKHIIPLIRVVAITVFTVRSKIRRQ